jgi:Flp pilus assembly protein TadG
MSWICNEWDASALAASMRRQARHFAVGAAGSTVTVFALALPVLVAAAGAAVDYSMAAATHSRMQAVADSAALAAARELQLARTDSSRITVVANNVVNGSLTEVTTVVAVDFQALTVRVVIEKQHTPFIRLAPDTKLHVTATAKMSGSMPLCLLGLNPSAPGTINLDQSALLTAPGCLDLPRSSGPVGMLV